MSGLDSKGQRGAPTRAPRPDNGWRRWLSLFAIACLAFLETGCQSGPFSNGCGSCSSCGFFQRLQARVATRLNRNTTDCCGAGVVSDAPVEYSTPATVIAPSIGPSYQSPPTSSAPSTVPSARIETPDDLNVIPPYKASPPASGGSTGSTSTAPKTSHYDRRSSSRSATRYRNDQVNVARNTVSTPEPTPRSAQGSAGSAGETGNALDNLPPLDLPGDVTEKTTTPPTPPAAGAKPDSISTDATPARTAASPAAAPAAGDADSAGNPVAPAPDSLPTASVGPGMSRFLAVDLNLAGGAAPSSRGLQWLVDRGYRTLLDLREPSEVPTSFITEVTRKGLRYIPLPVSVAAIDRERVDRFQFEVGAGEARPLFFFDSDGTRAGALWYIRRMTLDKVDAQTARREAEELGLTDKNAWQAAAGYLNKLSEPRSAAKPDASSAPAEKTSAAAVIRESSSEHSASAKSADSLISQGPAASVPTAPRATEPTGSFTPPASEPIADNTLDASTPAPALTDTARGPAIDPQSWRPFAAMVVTGLSVPLAFWTRSVVPSIIYRNSASLPAPEPRAKSALVSSGV